MSTNLPIKASRGLQPPAAAKHASGCYPLQDNRKYQAMTEEQADDLFLRIARIKAKLEKADAAHKEKLAKLEAAFKDAAAPDMAVREALEAELTAYILANPGRFVKPRKRPVGQIGTYGITTDPAYVEKDDEDVALEFAMLNGYDDLMIVTRKIDKTAALRRFTAGENVPGLHVVPAGDVAKLSFRKGYIEELEK